MTRWMLAALVLLFYLLHQDIWFWDTARPVVFGVLPIGLFFHVCYALAAALLMWALARYAWPVELEDQAGEAEEPR